jgi:hypothetical protein
VVTRQPDLLRGSVPGSWHCFPALHIALCLYVTGSQRGLCLWCGVSFESPKRKGPPPRYCSSAHRQAAYRARSAATAPSAAGPRVDGLLHELAEVLATPGEEARYAIVAVARDLLAATGRPLPADPPDPDRRAPDAYPRRRRPPKWTGRQLPRPASCSPRVYERVWDDDWGWQVTVRPQRGDGRPSGTGKPLWLRRHRAGDDPQWRRRYDILDEWDVPDSNALHRLSPDLIADAIDAERCHGFAYRNEAPYIARHFAGDVLERQLRNTAWALTRSEILRWLDLHGYTEPATCENWADRGTAAQPVT